jgi:4-amino-4-deoxy-L-arabinose transferase-like glycosyltransferase
MSVRMADSKRSWSSRLHPGAALVAVAVVATAHMRVEAAGPDYRGVLLPLDRIFDVGCAVALVVLAWVIGLSIIRRTDVCPESALERLLFTTAIGLGVVGTAVLALGALSLFQPWALSGLGLLLVWSARDALAGLRDESHRLREELGADAGVWVLIGLGLIATFLLLQSATPPTDWDVLTYHLDVPREYLDRGAVLLPEDNHHVAFVGLVHMLYVPLLAVGAESAPAVISAIVALLLALTMYAVGRRLFDEETGRLASVLVWGSPAILLVAVTARVDVSTTWFLVLAHFAVVLCLERREIGGWWWIAAVMTGLAVATKFSALAYLAGLGPVMLWVLLRERDRSLRSVLPPVGFGAVVVLVAAPWLLKNTLLLGAPLYPYLTELRLEPWLADYLGTFTVPASVDPDAFQIPALTREPLSIVALFTDPASMSPEGESDFYFANFVLLLLPLALLGSRRKVFALLVPPLLYSAVVLLADSWINLRYLIPALVMGTLVTCHGVAEVGRRLFSGPPVRSVWFATVVATCLLPAGFAAYYKLAETNPHQYWLGLRSERGYLDGISNPDIYLHVRVRRWINEHLPQDARVVMLFDGRGYEFEPDVLQDNWSRNWPILAAGEPWDDCMRSTGASHVLVNYGHLARMAQRGLDIGTVSWSDFSRFHRACLQIQKRLGGVVLYSIDR